MKIIFKLILVGPGSSKKFGIYLKIPYRIIILIQALEHKHGVRKVTEGTIKIKRILCLDLGIPC